MKRMNQNLAALVFTLALSTAAWAQEIGVKVDADQSADDTTISIKKGSSSTANKKKYIISDGSEDIAGDKDVLKKNAEKNWKAACDEWKKELKELNKDSKIISLSCGSMTCAKEGVESICKSKATYKIRVLEAE